jgi:DNA-binding MarR family transcriptional regulator
MLYPLSYEGGTCGIPCGKPAGPCRDPRGLGIASLRVTARAIVRHCQVTYSCVVHATISDLTPLADALRDVFMSARRQFAGSEQDKSVIALLAHLATAGPQRAADLAERACLDPSTVSRHLGTLEGDGYVDRTPDPDDGRATLLQVTAAGASHLAQVRQQRIAVLSDAVSDWSDKDIATLTRLSQRLANDLEQL